MELHIYIHWYANCIIIFRECIYVCLDVYLFQRAVFRVVITL